MNPTRLADQKSLSLLIVDDEVNVAAELADAAEDEGYLVHKANSAAAALAILAAHPEIGVMISDIRMPECDGLELTRRVLDGRGDATALEVILITGHATLDDAVLAVRTGAFDFVRKPFRLQQIFEAVARAVGRAIGRRRIAAAIAGFEAQRQLPPPGGSVHNNTAILLGLMHELRTPLVPILGFAEMLESKRCSPDDTAEYARLIGHGGKQLLSTVDDLLLLARIESDQLRLAPTAIALGPFLDALAQGHQPAAEVMGKAVSAEAASPLIQRADSQLLRRALDVLVRIALQRNPRGSVVALSAFAQGGVTYIVVGQAAGWRGEASAFAEDVATQVAPLGIRLARAVAALHGGSVILSGEQETAFTALFSLPEAVS